MPYIFSRNNKTGFPPSARMTAGRGRAIPGVVRVFLFPSFSSLARESSPNRKQQDWIPAFGENDSGEGTDESPRLDGVAPSAGVTDERRRLDSITTQRAIAPSFRHSRALLGNPVLHCEQQDWIPAFGENDGGEGKGREGPFPVSCVSFFFRHSRALLGNPVLIGNNRTGFPPSARMTAGRVPTKAPDLMGSPLVLVSRTKGADLTASPPSALLPPPSVILEPCSGIQS